MFHFAPSTLKQYKRYSWYEFIDKFIYEADKESSNIQFLFRLRTWYGSQIQKKNWETVIRRKVYEGGHRSGQKWNRDSKSQQDICNSYHISPQATEGTEQAFERFCQSFGKFCGECSGYNFHTIFITFWNIAVILICTNGACKKKLVCSDMKFILHKYRRNYIPSEQARGVSQWLKGARLKVIYSNYTWVQARPRSGNFFSLSHCHSIWYFGGTRMSTLVGLLAKTRVRCKSLSSTSVKYRLYMGEMSVFHQRSVVYPGCSGFLYLCQWQVSISVKWSCFGYKPNRSNK